MYFPYLRGRLFELIAIRELIEKSLISTKVMPVVEPVKLSSALIKTMLTFEDENRTLGLVRNPNVGNMLKDLEDEKNEERKVLFNQLLQTSDIFCRFSMLTQSYPRI